MSGDSRVDSASADLLDVGSVPLDCEQIQAVLMAYLARELGPGPGTLVREHLRHCSACQAEAATLSETLLALKAGDPGRSVPAILSERGRRRVLWAWTHPLLAWCVRWHHWVSLTVALLVLLAVFAALRRWRLSEPLPKGIPVLLEPKAVPPSKW